MNFNYRVYCYVNGKLLMEKLTNNTSIAYAVYKNFVENTQYISTNYVVVKLIYKGKILKKFEKSLDKSTKV